MSTKGIALALVVGTVVLAGCATKKYVAQQVDPVNSKVGQVDKNQQDTQRTVEEHETKISAASEKADSADHRASDALSRSDAASKKADQVRDDLRNELGERIANLEDYKPVGDATVVLFKFNSATLGDDAKEALDQLAASQAGSVKRYFIAIQGFTDKIGPTDYNLELSRRRAQAVQTYLIGQKNVPVYRIQIVGLGKDKPVNEGKTRDDRTKSRRVEVTVFSADRAQSAANQAAPGAQK